MRLIDVGALAGAPRFFEAGGLAAAVLRVLVFFLDGAFFLETGAFAAVFRLLVGPRFFETAFLDVFFLEGALAAAFFLEVFFFDIFFFEVFFLEGALAAVFFFEVFFLEGVAFFLDVRFLDALVRRVLTAARFLRLAALRAVLRVDVFFFDVFFLVAALFAGIVGLQDRS